MKSTNSQTQRIFDCLIASPGVEISSVHLHRVGSGNPNGWVNSLSRRISDCRVRLESLGQCIPAPRKEIQPDGSIHTFYKVMPQDSAGPLALTGCQEAEDATEHLNKNEGIYA